MERRRSVGLRGSQPLGIDVPVLDPPSGPVGGVLKSHCTALSEAYVTSYDIIPAPDWYAGPGPWEPPGPDYPGITDQIYSADLYIPSSTFEAIDAQAVIWGSGSYTASMLRVGQAGEGFRLADSADSNVPGPGLMSSQWISLDNSSGGSNPPATHPANVEVDFAPDIWHSVSIEIVTQPYTSDRTYYDFIAITIILDGNTIYDSEVELWAVNFNGLTGFVRSAGYQSFGADNEIYYTDNLRTQNYCADFEPLDITNPTDYPQFNGSLGNVTGDATVVDKAITGGNGPNVC